MQAELLRLVTAGSVDDGKSTLIGRLLYDTKQILADQLEHIEETSRAPRRRLRQPRAAHRRPARRARAGDHDRRRLPLVRHAAPPLPARRRARARPVHAQHGHRRLDRGRRRDPARRAQGRGRADAPPLLHRRDPRDPARRRRGQQDGPRRLLGGALPRDRGRPPGARRRGLGLHDERAIPMSALRGDNVVDRGDAMPWYDGPTLLEHLETIELAGDRNLDDRRFPVQWVIRPMADEHHDYRGYAGAGRGRRLARRRRGGRAAVRPRARASPRSRRFEGPLEAAISPAVGHDPARGRRRRRPRRHARRPRARRRPSRAS